MIEEHGPSEKAINGPTSASGDEISKLQRTPGEEKINTLQEEHIQESSSLERCFINLKKLKVYSSFILHFTF